MHKVALIYPYFRTKSPTELLFPPLGCANLASELKVRNIETRIFDCTFMTLSQVKRDILQFQPDIAGMYSMVTLTRSTFQIANWLRETLPDCLLAAGGPLPTLFPEKYADSFDLIFRGEADRSFPDFCADYFLKSIDKGHLDLVSLEKYSGLFIRNRQNQVENPQTHFSESALAYFPLPFRGDFNHAAYQQAWLELDGSKTTSIITTFGCSFDCDFCSRPVFGNRFRRRNLDLVFAEIDQIRQLGYDSLWIADDNFTLDGNFLREFCARIADKNIHWSCLSRVTGISPELAGMMKKSGCKRVHLGLETGSAETLKLMKKRATLEDGKNAVQIFSRAGIEVAAFFIVGYPGETIESIESTFQMALDLPLQEVSFNVPYPLPGSQLFERIGKVDLSRDWNEENETTFVYDSEFDPGWLRKRIGETMHAFTLKKAY